MKFSFQLLQIIPSSTMCVQRLHCATKSNPLVITDYLVIKNSQVLFCNYGFWLLKGFPAQNEKSPSRERLMNFYLQFKSSQESLQQNMDKFIESAKDKPPKSLQTISKKIYKSASELVFLGMFWYLLRRWFLLKEMLLQKCSNRRDKEIESQNWSRSLISWRRRLQLHFCKSTKRPSSGLRQTSSRRRSTWRLSSRSMCAPSNIVFTLPSVLPSSYSSYLLSRA